MMKNGKGTPETRRWYMSTALVLIWTTTMLAIALLLMSIVVVQLWS